MKSYWLISYTQKSERGNVIPANAALDVRPAVWLLTAVRRCPEANTILHFAIEISESMYHELKEEI